jgi:hypothetical protein
LQTKDEFSRSYKATTIAASEKDATVAGEDAPRLGKEPWEDPTKGTGKGSDVLMEFNPGVYPDAVGPQPADQKNAIVRARLGRSESDVSGVMAASMPGPAHFGTEPEVELIGIPEA